MNKIFRLIRFSLNKDSLFIMFLHPPKANMVNSGIKNIGSQIPKRIKFNPNSVRVHGCESGYVVISQFQYRFTRHDADPGTQI